jgi:signal transduction histidine kinase
MIARHAADPDETEALRARLDEAEEMLRAIRRGEIDALVVDGAGGSQVYTLHSAEEPYRTLVEQMQEGAVVLTARGDILYANASFAALVGAPLESVVGSRIQRFVNGPDRDEFETLLDAGSGRCRSGLIGSGSAALEVSLSLTTTVSTNGDRLNLIVTSLSEILEANSKRDRAERDNRTKDQFLAMLAHELRTPLGAITSAVQILESTPAGSEFATRAQGLITRQVAHVSRLIDDLLDVERVVSGKIRLDRQPLDMAEAVRRAVAVVAPLDRRIDLSIEPVWVDGDTVRLEQIVTNIVTNAVKYTPTGGTIHVALRTEGIDAVLSVEDTGSGISPEVLPTIFDLYVQADRTLDRSAGGLGIGLTLVRRLIELHGGTIVASSEGAGHGSRFIVRLRRIPSATTADALSTPPDLRAKPRRVLLIEDSGEARERLRMMLELAGHEVYAAADGVRGLEQLNALRPDVGIIDVSHPTIDGYQVARRLREEPLGRDMLLLALTDSSAPVVSKDSVGKGFDHHLFKPVDPDFLARLLSEGFQET